MAKQLDYHTIAEIFRRFEERDAEPKGELEHVNAYTLLVAVALSAQATDKGVNARDPGRCSRLRTRLKRCWTLAKTA